MVNQENEIRKVIKILKDATLVIKIVPFALVLTQVISLLSYLFGNETLSVFFDYCFYVSPSILLLTVLLSYIFRLCKWHKLECILPMLSNAMWVIDEYVIELCNVASYVNVGLIVVLSIASLINAYFVFLKN